MCVFESLTDLHACRLCPRCCGADRTAGKTGACGVDAELRVGRAALHMWEEPCISGKEGSGTVFFSGCGLGCIFCQNHTLAKAETGKKITVQRLTEIFFELEKQGANNINLVTPDHYLPQIYHAIQAAKAEGFSLPFVWNSGGYCRADALQLLEGLVDVYLVDFKYFSAETAQRYAKAPDYPKAVKSALKEMVRQCPVPVFDGEGRMKKGVIVRHLLLPGHLAEAKKIVRYVYETYGNSVYLSLMNQYTPLGWADAYPELRQKISAKAYDTLVEEAVRLGVENGFIQEGETAKEYFIPSFDGEGV